VADRTVQIRFESPSALREEFEKNIANRGIFVGTEEPFEVRQTIDVEIVLPYVDDSQVALSLLGEVVHCIPVEMAASGALPGIAVQFESTARELQDDFSSLLGQEPAPIPEKDKVGKQRRGSRRGAVRVPVRVMPTMSPPFEATSRDLSATGILLTMKGQSLPVGEVVRTCLWHPSGEPSIEIDGKVVREVHNRSGRIAAVAVAFDRNQSADPRIADVIEALRQAGHRSQLGGISGSIVDLGLANMLQMFGNTAPQGTLVVEHDGEQGWIAFAQGQFLGAELGVATGHEALVLMLDWGDGRFQFEATADPKLAEKAEPCSLDGAVLKAMCAIDEMAHADGEEDEDEDEAEPAPKAIHAKTTFGVDLEQEQISRSSLDKTAEAVLELARSGMPVERLTSIIPEPAAKVQATLEELVELRVLVPR
jgi:Tfp pilus assembly protein PilZ